MLEWDISIVIIIILLGFLAAFIDAVVGGGGLISIPALLAVGMPPSMALGTNKLASAFGSMTSAFRFTVRQCRFKNCRKIISDCIYYGNGRGQYCNVLAFPIKTCRNCRINSCDDLYDYEENWGNVRTFTN